MVQILQCRLAVTMETSGGHPLAATGTPNPHPDSWPNFYANLYCIAFPAHACTLMGDPGFCKSDFDTKSRNLYWFVHVNPCIHRGKLPYIACCVTILCDHTILVDTYMWTWNYS